MAGFIKAQNEELSLTFVGVCNATWIIWADTPNTKGLFQFKPRIF
jgi:hypothetical protein